MLHFCTAGLQAPRGGPSHARLNGAAGAAATAASASPAGRFQFSSLGSGVGTGLGTGLGASLGTGLGTGLGSGAGLGQSSKPPLYPGSSALGFGLGGYGLSAPTGASAGTTGGVGVGTAPGAAPSADFSRRRRSSNQLLDDGVHFNALKKYTL